MGKLIILFCLLLIVFTCFFVAGYYVMFDEDFTTTYTRAVCNGNTCADYEFTCFNGEIVNSVLISGLVTFDMNWTDLREDKNRC